MAISMNLLFVVSTVMLPLLASALDAIQGLQSDQCPQARNNCLAEPSFLDEAHEPEEEPVQFLQMRGNKMADRHTKSMQLPPPPADGIYLLKLLFMRHGMSCANVAWEDCTTDAAKIDEFMQTGAYNDTLNVLDMMMKAKDPISVGGINRSHGIKPKGTHIEGKWNIYMTSDRAHECIVKSLSKELHDGDFDENGNIIGVSPLVKDPHITHCAMEIAATGSQVLAKYLDEQNITLDLVGASTLKRAIESVHLMFKPGRAMATRKLRAVTALPFLNERDPGTPTQPECYPYPPEQQLQQMRDIFGSNLQVEADLVSGTKGYPSTAQQYDKFKVILALNVLPFLHADRSPILANSALVDALAAKREDGSSVFPDETSSYNQTRDDPLLEVSAAGMRYKHGSRFAPEDYEAWKTAGAQEYVLGMGSHSVVIKRYCMEDGGDYVNNYAVVEKLIAVNVTTVDGKTTFTVSEQSGKCRRIMDAPPSPKAGTLTATDLGDNCKIPFDIQPLIDLHPQPSTGLTQCAALGSKPEDFPLVESLHLFHMFV